jgi:uncharacterized protein with HEPN domain
MNSKSASRIAIAIGYADRIAQTLKRAESNEGFIADYDLQYSVAHSISQIAEVLTQVIQAQPEAATTINANLPYHDIRRMRDKIQHHYGSIDPEIVWDIASLNMPALKTALEELLESDCF